MHLASYNVRGRSSFGVVSGDGIVDLKPRLAPRYQSVLDILRADALGEESIHRCRRARGFPARRGRAASPVPGGEKFCASASIMPTGLKWPAPAATRTPNTSMFFPPNTLVGHNQPILRPPESEQLEYEGEIALIIGKTARRIPKDRALDYVAGITMCNEGTIRDWIRHGRFNVTQGKSWDATGSIGPWMTTGVDLRKPLRITVKVNGEVTQDDTSDHMIFGFVEILSYVSTFMTLKPGDIVATGTPTKLDQKPGERKWLKAGDVFEMTVAEIGTLRNVVVDEKH
jgi:2-keto-4-pentenoate hydratase/2-oxohepta-3-ene-1,7-dioic acid hydratase in catechol pathway